MTGRHAPVPTLQQRLYWPTVVACTVVGIAGLTGMAHGVAPKVAAAQTFTTFPEQVAEPSAHGGLGGPLAIPSIGVVATTEPPSFVVTKPPNTLRATPSRPTATDQALTGAPSPTPEAAIAIPVATTPPPVTTTAPAATTTPTDTALMPAAPATTDTPTPTEATTTSATTTATSTATTSEEP